MDANGPRIEVVQHDGITEVEILDEEILDEIAISKLAETLFSLIEEQEAIRLLLSFSRVRHLSSSALGVLIRIHKRISESGGELRLCCIGATIYEIFKITKLDKVFEIYEDKGEAVRSLGG